MELPHHIRISIMSSLVSRRKKTRQIIKNYMINESMIDSDDKDIEYQFKTDNKDIRKLQSDLRKLEFLIFQLKGYNK